MCPVCAAASLGVIVTKIASATGISGAVAARVAIVKGKKKRTQKGADTVARNP